MNTETWYRFDHTEHNDPEFKAYYKTEADAWLAFYQCVAREYLSYYSDSATQIREFFGECASNAKLRAIECRRAKTTASPAYDYGYTFELQASENERIVLIPSAYFNYQCGRYASGMNMVVELDSNNNEIHK